MSDYYSYLRNKADPNKKTPRLAGENGAIPGTRITRKELDEVYLQVYESLIGSMKSVPKVIATQTDTNAHSLGKSASSILSKIDGVVTYGDVLTMSSMSRFDTCRALAQLIVDGVIR